MPVLERPIARPRPVYLDLFRIRLPLPGLVSILHRISGIALFLIGIPLLLWALQASFATPDGFPEAKLSSPWLKLVLLGLAWAYLHHFCAGIRFLLLDLHRGIDLAPTRRWSGVVLIVSLALTLLVALRLW